jgi:quercetin dioxygenase-like cupin family protein
MPTRHRIWPGPKSPRLLWFSPQEVHMSYRTPLIAVAALGLGALPRPAPAQPVTEDAAMHYVMGADLAWENIEVPGFKTGLKIASVHGDPSVPDEEYTLRLYLPDGYAFPPHFHPRAENLTVLEGSLLLAMGKKFDDTALRTTYAPGDFLFIAGEHPHFGKVEGDTVLQLHGLGPFDIIVVEGQGMTDY